MACISFLIYPCTWSRNFISICRLTITNSHVINYCHIHCISKITIYIWKLRKTFTDMDIPTLLNFAVHCHCWGIVATLFLHSFCSEAFLWRAFWLLCWFWVFGNNLFPVYYVSTYSQMKTYLRWVSYPTIRKYQELQKTVEYFYRSYHLLGLVIWWVQKTQLFSGIIFVSFCCLDRLDV